MSDWDQAYSSRWWVTGFPCAALVLAYGGTPAVLCASMGTLLWHMLDMAGDAMKGQSLLVWWYVCPSVPPLVHFAYSSLARSLYLSRA